MAVKIVEYELRINETHFIIRREPLGLWDLWIDEMPVFTFSTPQEAAIAVYEQKSGYTLWDQLDMHSAPDSLHGWTVSSHDNAE